VIGALRRIHTSGPGRLPVHWRRALALIVLVAAAAMTLAVVHHRPTSTAAPSAAAGSAPEPPAAAPGGPSPPIRIDITSIGVSAPVDPLVLNADGTLEVPKDFNRAGYYTGRPAPGAIGPAIIVAHVDSKTGPAVFYRLREVKPGDEVSVTRADGTAVLFIVDRVEQHPKDAFPTADVYGPTPGATLRLITCAGSFNGSAGSYRDNLIAFAHLKA
jgi:hypothetical protein